ncbi:MAG: restriction endonuclease subunit S [Bacteroidetes bacterium]|nr:restriction endonuclease subunit S [Bacteroidota bacterium]MCB9044143.1 restriction endonuclease subunit S [Chitinophagales bacterium]
MSLLRIDEIFNFEKGVLQSSKCVPGEYDFITASSDWKTHNEYTHDCEALIFAAAASGSLGRTHYVNGKFISSDLCFIITPKDQENLPVDLKFYHILFNELKDEIVRNTKAGTSKEAIGLGSFGKYQLPYFDIDTQIEIKNRFVKSEDLKSDLSNELNYQVELVKKLRQQLLQDAVQGKLVEQNPKDEPASELLKKIKAEKEKLIAEKVIKQGKIQEAEKQEELLFEIPDNWVWCNLDEISKNITDGTHQTPTYTKEGRIFLSAQNIKPFKFMPEEHKFVSEETYQEIIKNRKPEKGDILIARVGAGIGEAAVINQEIEFCFYVSLGLVQPFKEYLNTEYLALVINSPYGVKYAKGNISSKGGSAGNFNLGRIRSFLIPLPPLAEQNHIVQKLDELMHYCNELEASIKQSESQNEKLLKQVLREALRKEPVEV